MDMKRYKIGGEVGLPMNKKVKVRSSII